MRYKQFFQFPKNSVFISVRYNYVFTEVVKNCFVAGKRVFTLLLPR
jgi:hypothetical protein